MRWVGPVAIDARSPAILFNATCLVTALESATRGRLLLWLLGLSLATVLRLHRGQRVVQGQVLLVLAGRPRVLRPRLDAIAARARRCDVLGRARDVLHVHHKVAGTELLR